MAYFPKNEFASDKVHPTKWSLVLVLLLSDGRGRCWEASGDIIGLWG